MLEYDVLIILIAVLTAFYFYFDHKAKYWQRRGVNGPKALPFIGNLLDNFRMPQNELEDLRLQKYGKVYGVMQGLKPVLTIGDPDLLKQIFITDFPVFMNHRCNFEDPILAHALIELKSDEWRRVRRILSPAFTTGKLKAMQPLIEKCIEKTFKYFDLTEERNEELDIKITTLAYTLDVIALCVFSINTNASQNPDEEFVVTAHKLTNFPLWRMITRALVPSKLQVKYDLQILKQNHVKYFNAILKNLIRKRREIPSEQVDFVKLLLNAEYKKEINEKENEFETILELGKNQLSEEEIMANGTFFFIAGFETTATFLHFNLYALAIHEDVQEKLFEEISKYFEEHKTAEIDSLNALPYFNAVFNESMRLYTPVTVFEHICGEDYKLNDLIIEKGVVINLPIYAMSHDPGFFPNPHQFIPERFMPENKDEIKPYTFIPFGLGPRTCIGNRFSNFHAKLFLANFVKNYKIIKTENTPEKPEFDGKFLLLACKPTIAAVRRRTN